VGLKVLYHQLRDYSRTKQGERLIRAAHLLFVAGVVGLLIYQLSEVGWSDMWTSLPAHPLFYLLLPAMYFLLPVTEALIYGRLWNLRVQDCLPVMIRKRVLNMDVVGYSGEVYLFAWAKDRAGGTRRTIMATIKDNLIMASAASIAAASLILTVFVATRQIRLPDFVANPDTVYISVGVFVLALIAALAYRFRGAFFSLRKRTLAALGGIHLTRFFLGYAFQVAQWWIVIPMASFETWAVLLTVFILINRIPFMPSSDLVFVSAGAGLSPLLDIPVAPVLSMLLVRSVADRLMNLILFTTTVWRERHPLYTRADVEAIGEPRDGADLDESQAEVPVSLNT